MPNRWRSRARSGNRRSAPDRGRRSQLYAIEAAERGKALSFTARRNRQIATITAMIANALAQGKTVLFVAEKWPLCPSWSDALMQ